MSNVVRWLSLLLLVILTGSCGASGSGQKPASQPRAPGAMSRLSPVSTFTVDISDVADHADALPVDERREQIADWALAGVLGKQKLSALDFHLALGQPLLRVPELEVVGGYAYGPGRRAVLPDGRVLVVVAKSDPQPEKTVARLADRVRMEQGDTPQRFDLYRYKSSLVAGRITIEALGEVAGSEIFSAKYGYLEKPIRSKGELESWLGQTDDLTYARHLPDGALLLGGRSYGQAGGHRLGIDDVAALYRAHLTDLKPLLGYKQIQRTHNALVDAHRKLVASYNTNARLINSRQPPDCKAFDAAARRLGQLLPEAKIAESASCTAGSPHDIATAEVALLERVKPLLMQRLSAMKQQLDAARTKPLLVRSLGFSLDPQWEVSGLVADLRLLQKDPQALLKRALDLAKREAKSRPRERGGFFSASQATHLAKYLTGAKVSTEPYRQYIDDVIAEATESGQPRVEEIPSMARLQAALAQGNRNAQAVRALLGFLESQHRVQCARYDGPLYGTSVGMTLFYTDLIGKLWAGLDYWESAPADRVAGFLTMPRMSGAQEFDLDRTRIWFGPRVDRMTRSSESDVLRFAPIAARIYAASSSSQVPGVETTPAETSRRVLDWWTHHFLEVAEYEPQYHRQNQIQKWSVVTAWLAESELVADLGQTKVSQEWRFDRWAKDTGELRQSPLPRVLPRQRWTGTKGERECMELLASREYGGGVMVGGVSLGSGKTVREAPVVSDAVPRHLRRPGLDYTQSSRDQQVFSHQGVTQRVERGASGSYEVVRKLADDRLSPDSNQARELHIAISSKGSGDAKIGMKRAKLEKLDQNLRIALSRPTDAATKTASDDATMAQPKPQDRLAGGQAGARAPPADQPALLVTYEEALFNPRVEPAPPGVDVKQHGARAPPADFVDLISTRAKAHRENVRRQGALKRRTRDKLTPLHQTTMGNRTHQELELPTERAAHPAAKGELATLVKQAALGQPIEFFMLMRGDEPALDVDSRPVEILRSTAVEAEVLTGSGLEAAQARIIADSDRQYVRFWGGDSTTGGPTPTGGAPKTIVLVRPRSASP